MPEATEQQITEKKTRLKKKRYFSFQGYLYTTLITTLFFAYIFYNLRVKNYYIGELFIVSDELIIIIYVGVMIFGGLMYSIVIGNRNILDSFAVSSLPFTSYLVIRTMIIYPSIRLQTVLIMVISILISFLFTPFKELLATNKKHVFIKLARGTVRCMGFGFILLSYLCIYHFQYDKTFIEYMHRNSWILEDPIRVVSDDISYEPQYEDFKYTRFIKLSIEERYCLVQMLVDSVMEYLTSSRLTPVIKSDTKMSYNSMGRYIYEENVIYINPLLFDVSDDTDIEELINTVLHECRHAYQHYAGDTLPDGGLFSYTLAYKEITSWRENNYNYLLPEKDYFSYKTQPTEEDAQEFADIWTERLISFINH